MARLDIIKTVYNLPSRIIDTLHIGPFVSQAFDVRFTLPYQFGICFVLNFYNKIQVDIQNLLFTNFDTIVKQKRYTKGTKGKGTINFII